MEIVKSILVGVHVGTGIMAFISGLLAIITTKGGIWHIRSGKTYFYCMILVAVTGISLSLIIDNIFLLAIGYFSFYMTWAGKRSINNKSLKANALDWIFLTLAFGTAVFMIYTLHMVLLVFGGIFSLLLLQDLKVFIKVLRNGQIGTHNWLVRHIGMMMGAYIATVTAFVVTNVPNVSPAWLPWLLPTAIGTPVIAYWTKKVVTGKFQR